MNEYLVELLAKTDALFSPVRWAKADPLRLLFRQVVTEGRAAFFRHGLPLPRSTGRSAAEQKTFTRLIARLESDGMIELAGGAGKATGIKLTPTGDDETRRALGMQDFDSALAILDQIWRLREDGESGFDCVDRADPVEPRHYCSEAALTGVEYGTDGGGHYVCLSEDAMPLLTRELLVVNSSSYGHAFYAASSTGAALARQRADKGIVGPWPLELPDYGDEALFRQYRKMRVDEIEALQHRQPNKGNVLPLIPVPAAWRGVAGARAFWNFPH